MRVCVVGAGGQLGRELWDARPEGCEALFLNRQELDITSYSCVKDVVEEFQPKVVINAAAFTLVDRAETEIQTARIINTYGPENLARVCRDQGAVLIHISTDFVFDGKSSRPYRPEDEPNPLNVYGQTKLEGERKIIESGLKEYAIVRTSWVYSKYGSNFLNTMLRLFSERDSLGIVNDQFGCPTSAKCLANAIWRLATSQVSVNNKLDKAQKIFHWSDSGVATWYDFAVEIQKKALENGLLESAIPISPISSTEYPVPAKRPSYSVMDTSAIRNLLGLESTSWQSELEKVILSLIPYSSQDIPENS